MLALEVPGRSDVIAPRSPAMALGLTTHLWDVHDLLHYPVPRVVKLDWSCQTMQAISAIRV